jgi:hypothetical protein
MEERAHPKVHYGAAPCGITGGEPEIAARPSADASTLPVPAVGANRDETGWGGTGRGDGSGCVVDRGSHATTLLHKYDRVNPI